MSKRISVWFLILSLMVSLFTGCSNSSSTQSNEKESNGSQQQEAKQSAPSKEKVLRIGAQAWMLEKFQLDEAAQQFMKDHPGVKVEISKVELADTTSYLLQWSQGKTNVDLAIGGSREQAVQYAAKDLIINFENDFFDDKLKKEDYIPAFLQLGNIEGTQYMIPLMGEVMYLVVRKDLMKEAGLVDANGNVIPPQTWDELYDYAKKLTKTEGGKVTQTGLAIDWGNDFIAYTYLSTLQAMRGSVFEGNTNKIDFQSKEAHDLVSMWAKLVQDGLVPVDVFADTNAGRTNFKAGKVAMHLTAHSRWPEYSTLLGSDKITVMPLPGAAKNGSLGFIHGMLIPKASPEQELAKAFIKERLMDKDFQMWTLNHYGKMPVLKKNFEGADAPEWKEILAAADKSTTAPLYKDWAKIQKKMQIEFQKGITGKQTVDETLQNLNKELNSINTSTGLK